MKALIIGYGSIGQRHHQILNDLGIQVEVLSKHKNKDKINFKTLNILVNNYKPSYIIISNATADRFIIYNFLIEMNYSGKILLEKPAFDKLYYFDLSNNLNVFVGYNMRFHPLLQKLKEELKGKKVISAQSYVGQYLPLWRKNRNYKSVYSSNKDRGGGVLRDLSHELDYLCWLFGAWKKLISIGGKFSKLEIDSDDSYSIFFSTEKCISCYAHLNYLDKHVRRNIIVNTDDTVYEIDFINNIYKKNKEINSIEIDNNFTYREMHLDIMNDKTDILCSIQEGIEIINMIEKIESSSRNPNFGWIIA